MDHDSPPPHDLWPPTNFALTAAVFEGGLAVVAVALGWLLGQKPLETFPHTLPDAARAVAWGAAATLPMLALAWLCIKCPLRPFTELTRVVDELLLPLFRHCRPIEMAVISVLAGLGEEILFRGVIQQGIRSWAGEPHGVWIGLTVAALLFGVLHQITLVYGLLAALIGLYLGWLWILSGDLLVPITAHATYDFLVLVYLVKVREPTAASRGQNDLKGGQNGEENERPPD